MTGTTVNDVLAADSELVQKELTRLLAGREPAAELYDLVADYPTRPSKGIRPALCLATCRAHGGRTEDATGVAVAIELLHNAFLVHDDICDGALRRRGDAALHVRHGVPLALNAGNALAWLGLEPLLENVRSLPPALAFELVGEFHDMVRRTIEGQALELRWRERGLDRDFDRDAYLDLVLAKTAWYSTIHPCRAGALIGAAGEADRDALSRFGFFLGAVLQIRDDIENITDRAEEHGKDFGSDIIEGKPTLLLIRLFEVAPAAARQRAERLIGARGDRGGVPHAERIDEVVALMEEYGAIDYACAFADGLAGAALAEFDVGMGWLPDSVDKSFVRSLAMHLRDPVVRGR